MSTEPWYPLFERQSLFLRAAERYRRTVRCELRRSPDASLSTYDPRKGEFHLADDDGSFATVNLVSGKVRVVLSEPERSRCVHSRQGLGSRGIGALIQVLWLRK
jgi:hypothetical protein